MTLARLSVRLWFAVAGLAIGATGAAAAEGEPLQPFQMVRSLQLVQDRIADGDHAALPMQRKLLELIDAKLRGAAPETFADRRNFRSLLIYAMSGGNPVTVDVVRARLSLSPPDKAVLDGVLDYLTGRPKRAGEALSDIDPLTQSEDLGAFFALVKGSIMAADEPAKALALFDKARLLGPGTLVEEAALRRSIALAIGQKDAARFVQWSNQYVRRFLRSPYASQFADTFVNGVMDLSATVDFAEVDDVIARMAPEQRQVIYLRLARRGAIEGVAAVSAFAAPRAGEAGATPENDPRAMLYAALADVTSENVDAVAKRLEGIDAARLSRRDRELFDAVRKVSTQITAPLAPEPAAAPEVDAPPATMDTATAAAQDGAANAGDEFVPEVEDAAMPGEKASAETVADKSAAPGVQAASAEAAPDPSEDEANKAADITLSSARDALKSIDALLEESPR